MATLPKESSFTPAPAGPHPAICYRVIDLGTQETTFQGVSSRKHQLLVTWELFCDERMGDGRRYSIGKKYTWSTHKKSTFRKDLEAWRGKPFVESDFGPGGFDIKNIIGAACLVNVKHFDKAGDIGASVEGVMKLPKGMSVGKLENDPLYLWLSADEFDERELGRLSPKMQEIILKAPEYRAITSGETVAHTELHSGVDPDDEIPF